MAKAKLVTRSATTSTVTDDNLNKASALTHAEMDSNLINLRDSSFGIADDSSTVLQVTHDKTITVAGAGTVGTALSGDTLTITGSGITATSTDTLQNKTIDTANNTITITESDISDLGSYITASSTDTLTNKTFDANGTGNSISNIETADIAAGTLVTAAEGIGSNNNDTTIPTSAAVKAYADSVGGGGGGTITALNNQAENRLVSIGSTTTELDGEANLTFDGSTLALDGVTIADNEITTNRSNDNLNISANGTGQVITAANGDFGGFGNGERNVMYHKDHAAVFATRSYANKIEQDIKIDSGQSDSASSDDRWRNYMQVHLDLNGKSSTNNDTLFMGRGPNQFLGVLPSNSGTGNSTLGNAVANNNFIFASTSNTGDLTISQLASNTGSVEMEANTGTTVTFTDARVYNSNAQAYGSGTENIGTLYHFKANAAEGFDSITNEYGVHTPDSMQNLIGGVTLQNGDITTSAVSITDNVITTNRSNDSLGIGSNGTGQINLSTSGNFSTADMTESAASVYGSAVNTMKGVGLLYKKDGIAEITATADRQYVHSLLSEWKLNTGINSSNSNMRFRNYLGGAMLDMNGSSSTSTAFSRGIRAVDALSSVVNSNATTSTLGSAVAGNMHFTLDLENSSGDVTVTNAAALNLASEVSTTSGRTGTITNSFGANYQGGIFGGGTGAITNEYGFYVAGMVGTNKYAFYDASNSLSVFGDIQTQAVSITDNLITTNRSNDNLNIQANGTGRVNVGDVKLEEAALWENVFGNSSRIKGNALTYEDLAVNPNDLTDRELGHAVYMGTKITASSTNSNFRPRAIMIGSAVELDGFSYTNTSQFRGPLGAQIYGSVGNGTSTDATCNVVRAVETSATIQEFSGVSGAITVVDAIGNHCVNYYDRNGTGDINVTNEYGFKFAPEAYNAGGGTGTTTITNSYAFHCEANSGNATTTNTYAFYDAANVLSRFGAVILANQAGDPSGVTDSAHIYAKDDAGSSEVYVRDEAGNVTKISPHNDAGEWEYYSVNKNTGKKVRVNMERMIRKLEEITGETFIESE
jgi:hypothetical protein